MDNELNERATPPHHLPASEIDNTLAQSFFLALFHSNNLHRRDPDRRDLLDIPQVVGAKRTAVAVLDGILRALQKTPIILANLPPFAALFIHLEYHLFFIHFGHKPPEVAIRQLLEHGYRWSGKLKRWEREFDPMLTITEIADTSRLQIGHFIALMTMLPDSEVVSDLLTELKRTISVT